jgi:hypothetical protein
MMDVGQSQHSLRDGTFPNLTSGPIALTDLEYNRSLYRTSNDSPSLDGPEVSNSTDIGAYLNLSIYCNFEKGLRRAKHPPPNFF